MCLVRLRILAALYLAGLCGTWQVVTAAEVVGEVLEPVSARFRSASVDQTPDFRRHVVPLLGRLGCNGRACHGSFQGRGGFQLSLFGYDFQADHAALLDSESPRVDPQKVGESLILNKPTSAEEHEGGKRYERESWHYHLLRRWIELGANYKPNPQERLQALEVTPSEILFSGSGEKIELRAVAVWEDGTREDVTPLCRFRTNDDSIATVGEDGHVHAGEAGDTHVVVFYDNGVVPVPVLRPVTDLVEDRYPDIATHTRVDELVVTKLRKLGIVPSELSSDVDFLRRVHLDLTGTLPTVREVKTFLADTSSEKRSRTIEALLESPGYVAWWTTLLCDFTGNNDQQLNNVLPPMQGKRNVASQAWFDWIFKRVSDNTPYDELVAGVVTAKSRREGQSYREFCDEMSAAMRGDDGKSMADMDSMPFYWARRDFRAPEPRAINFAYAFLGIRIQCAQCHKHPFDQWSKQDFQQFTAIFNQPTSSNVNNLAQIARQRPQIKSDLEQIMGELSIDQSLRGGKLRKELGNQLAEGKTIPFPEVFVNARGKGRRRGKGRKRKAAPVVARILGEERLDTKTHTDLRVPLMEWLRSSDNRYFASAFVNRVWANYFNVGIVDPPDDMSRANPPSNRQLLEFLSRGFIDSGFDMKWVHRTILNSQTYQRSWQPNETNAGDERNFSKAILRRLPAEVAYDALVMATASDEQAESISKNLDGRAIAIAASSGRYANRNPAGFALRVFGRSVRESNCDCDRADDPSLLQTVFLRNDRDVLAMIDRRDEGWLDQVAQAYELSRPTPRFSQSQTKQRRSLGRQIRKLQKQIKNQKEVNQSAELAKSQKRLANLRARLRRLNKAGAATGPVVQKEVATSEIVQEVYLRTLSRYPTGHELERCQTYIRDAEDTLNGIRGVLWAVLNTKEFIVNH